MIIINKENISGRAPEEVNTATNWLLGHQNIELIKCFLWVAGWGLNHSQNYIPAGNLILRLSRLQGNVRITDHVVIGLEYQPGL